MTIHPNSEQRKKLKRYDIPGHAHELTFSCYHRFHYLNDPICCALFIDELSQAREHFLFVTADLARPEGTCHTKKKRVGCIKVLTWAPARDGWESRLVEICNENTNDVSGLCLEIHDLIVSKLYAGRQKDIEFFRAATNLGLISKGTLTERINKTSISGVRKDMIESYIKKEFSQ